LGRRSAWLKTEKRDARIIAGCVLAIEMLWWAVGSAILFGAAVNPSSTFVMLGAVSVVLMFLTLMAIFLLIQAPRGGVWLGLFLQIPMLGQAVAFWLISFIGLFFAIPLAIIAALSLAAAWPEGDRA
jgi:hypothetical protein